MYQSRPTGTAAPSNVLHCADNTAANGAFVNAYSAASDVAHIVASGQCAIACLNICLWLYHVQSAANLADVPTRKGSELLQQRVAAQRVEFVPPVFADRVGEAAGFLKPQFELVSNFVCLSLKSLCGAFLRACLSSCASRRSLRV